MMFALARQIPEADALHPGRQVGEEQVHGRRAHRQDAGHHRLRQYRLHRRRPRAGPEDEGHRLRPLPLRRARGGRWACEKVELDELLRRAPTSSPCTRPLTDKTRNILGAEALAKTKKGVRIINCARGGLVDEAALRRGHRSRGHVGGRGVRRVRRGAGQGQPAVRPAQRGLHAAPWRLHHRGAGERGAAGRRADVGLSAARAPSPTR